MLKHFEVTITLFLTGKPTRGDFELVYFPQTALVLALGFCFGALRRRRCRCGGSGQSDRGEAFAGVLEPIQPTQPEPQLRPACFAVTKAAAPREPVEAPPSEAAAKHPSPKTTRALLPTRREATVAGAGACRKQRRRRTQPDDPQYRLGGLRDQGRATPWPQATGSLSPTGRYADSGETLTYNPEQQTGEAHNVRMETGTRRTAAAKRQPHRQKCWAKGITNRQKPSNMQLNGSVSVFALVYQGHFVRSRSGKRHRRCQTRRASCSAAFPTTAWADFRLTATKAACSVRSATSDGVTYSVPIISTLNPISMPRSRPAWSGERGAVFERAGTLLPRPDYR